MRPETTSTPPTTTERTSSAPSTAVRASSPGTRAPMTPEERKRVFREVHARIMKRHAEAFRRLAK
jgi:hypothetical protein